MRLTIGMVMLAAFSLVSNQANGQVYQQQYGQSFGTQQSQYSQEFYSPSADVTTKTVAKSYREAYQEAQAGDKPLLVLVTATWCPPCQVMKQTTIPQLMRSDSFKDFHFATVDLDQEKELGKQLIGKRGLPQLIMFEKEGDKWVRRYLRGIQSVETVQAFIAQASMFRTASAEASESTIEK